MKWTDPTGNGRAWMAHARCVTLTVHNYTGRAGWWLTSVAVDAISMPLETEDLEVARRTAVEMARQRLQEAVDALTPEDEYH